GVPIYWLGGAKVADDYADFYDGGWDSNVPRTRTGGTISGTPRTWTGSNSDGTRYASQAMGATQARVSFPKTQGSEISGGNASSSITRFPVYALSPVITVSLRPGQVKGVMVDQDTHNSVRVRWTKPAEASAAPVTRFTIWTRTRNAADNGWIVDLPTTDANGWIRRADVSGGSTTSRVLTGLPSGVRQEVRISARADRAGQTPPTLYGDNSAPVSFTTAAANAPGAPAAPTVSATADTHTSLDVSWSAPTNTGPAITGYDLQYRAGTSGDFAAGPQDVTGTSATIGSLEEGTSYQVQVRATNAVGHSGWSASGTGTTTAQLNSAPEFASDTATRSLPENTAAGTDIGAPLTATDADAGDTLTYSLSGSDAASFYIVAASGQLRTWSGVTYDFESRSSYTVTVEVSDSTATDTIAVTIALTDADEPPARPVPTFGTTTATSLVVNWQEPANSGPDIDDYDVQYRLASTAPSGAWTAHTHVGTATTTTIGSLQAGQSYQVQVRAANDEGTGDWSEPGTATAAANSAPAFVLGSYGFTLTENADGTTTAVDVGTVSATDADSGDTVSYSIAAGNTGGVFAIASNGAITYTGSGENFEGFADPANAFTLTVRASDDHNASADVAVTVAVTDVEGEAPAAPAAPTFGRTTSTSLAVNWLEPANTGPAITDYDVWYREEGTSGSFIGHWS
ncbi:MAG: fibronectin type III domain-containing protein, partial [bacterium]|nr:fibronectin type III domain-containing protein [bacterium]